MPEKNLSILLNSINPRLSEPDYVFCTLSLEKYNSLEELQKFAPKALSQTALQVLQSISNSN